MSESSLWISDLIKIGFPSAIAITAAIMAYKKDIQLDRMKGDHDSTFHALQIDLEIIGKSCRSEINNLIISRRTAGKHPEAALRVIDCWRAAGDPFRTVVFLLDMGMLCSNTAR